MGLRIETRRAQRHEEHEEGVDWNSDFRMPSRMTVYCPVDGRVNAVLMRFLVLRVFVSWWLTCSLSASIGVGYPLGAAVPSRSVFPLRPLRRCGAISYARSTGIPATSVRRR